MRNQYVDIPPSPSIHSILSIPILSFLPTELCSFFTLHRQKVLSWALNSQKPPEKRKCWFLCSPTPSDFSGYTQHPPIPRGTGEQVPPIFQNLSFWLQNLLNSLYFLVTFKPIKIWHTYSLKNSFESWPLGIGHLFFFLTPNHKVSLKRSMYLLLSSWMWPTESGEWRNRGTS